MVDGGVSALSLFINYHDTAESFFGTPESDRSRIKLVSNGYTVAVSKCVQTQTEAEAGATDWCFFVYFSSAAAVAADDDVIRSVAVSAESPRLFIMYAI